MVDMNLPEFGAMVEDIAAPPGYSAATLAHVRYRWEVELGLQRRDRHYLITKKRKIQNIIQIVKEALKGPYGHEFSPHYIDELRRQLLLVKRELESLCD